MKIEWLNADCTEAIVTRGWWRPKSTVVHLSADTLTDLRARWMFSATRRVVQDVNWTLAGELSASYRKALRDAADSTDWTDTGRMPKARLLGRRA